MNHLKVFFMIALTSFLVGGCATVQTPAESDPLESVNRSVLKFNQKVDDVVLKPVAQGYTDYVAPEFRTCVANFFANLEGVNSAVNNVLQGKFAAAVNDTCRVLLNSTVGLLGLVDAASELGFPKKDEEDFGQTLGYWGLGAGPYLVLPFFGPTTLRDFTGRLVDGFIDPLANHKPVNERLVAKSTDVVDTRARLLPATNLVDRVALDRYSFIRDAYLARRESQIRDGMPAEKEVDDYYPEMGASFMRRASYRSVFLKAF